MNVNDTAAVLSADVTAATFVATTATPAIESKMSEGMVAMTMLICITVITLGVLGNALVLLVFANKWSHLKSAEIFMVGLAVADLISATFIPTKIVLELMSVSFHPIKDEGCKIITFLSVTSITVSALTLLAVSIDRFIIVKWPLHERPYHRTFVLVIMFIWVIAFGIGGIYFVGDKIKLHKVAVGLYQCMNFFTDQEFVIHTLIVFVVQVVLPIVVMTLLYTLIILELRKNERNKMFAHCEREMKIRHLQNRKATKLVLTVVVVFYVCILPLSLFFLVYTFNALTLSQKDTKYVFSFLTMLQICNAVANPVIYSKLHVSFRRDTIKLICSCCYKKEDPWNSMQSTARSLFNMSSFRWSKRKNSKSSLASLRTRVSITSLHHRSKPKYLLDGVPEQLCELMSDTPRNSGGSPSSLEMEEMNNGKLPNGNINNNLKVETSLDYPNGEQKKY